LAFPFKAASSPVNFEAGLLLSFNAHSSKSILARFGVSFLSSAQACSNAESEIHDWNWKKVQKASESKWEDVLSRIEISTKKENSTVVELLYSSVSHHYRLLENLITLP
jgi:putative alpha-1,2-mannosidase